MRRYLKQTKDLFSLSRQGRIAVSNLSDINCRIREHLTVQEDIITLAGLKHGYISLFHIPRGPEKITDYGLAVYTQNSLCVEVDGTDYLNASRERPRKHLRALENSSETRTEERIGICFDRWFANYYHWMVYCAPKLILLNKFLGVNKFFIPTDLAAMPTFILETFQQMGLSDSALVPISCGQHSASELCFVHGASPSAFTGQITRRGLVSLEGINKKSENRTIFLRRGSKVHAQRRLTNEEEVISMCLRRGIEVIDPGSLSLQEQINLFSSVQTVISVHGAALTNLLWMKPGGRIIEIATGPQPHYRALAENLGHNWLSLTARKIDTDVGGHNGVFIVNTLMLEKIIDDQLKI